MIEYIMKLNKKTLIAAAIGFFATVGGYSYPYILRSQIEKRIPGVEFADASLGFSGVTLSRVKINKDWIKGELDTVISDFEGQNILIEGGNLDVNLDKRTKNGESSSQKREIKFNSVDLNVSSDKYQVSIKDSYSDGDKICFLKAKLEKPEIRMSNASLDGIEFKGAQVTDLLAKGIKVDIKAKKAEIEEVKAKLTFEKQTFPVEASEIKLSHKPDKVQATSVKVLHPWLSSDWAVFKQIEVSHSDKWNVALGKSKVQFEPETLAVSGEEDCSTWIESLPESIKTNHLDQVKFTGKLSFSVGLRPKPVFQLKSDCKATCSTVPNLRKKFQYTIYSPKGEKSKRDSGLGTREWIPIGLLGDMPIAAINMEDPGFNRHRGFIVQAFFNSLTDNLKEGRFFRGGSTITMQLAKNLWLTREKTLGRKVQELFLAQALESCYSKDEILELYLNVVEFGPNKYGVAEGAHHWFNRSPAELMPNESFWLASILPRPNKVSPPDEKALERIEKLMKRLATDGRIPDLIFETVESEPSEDKNEQ